MREKKLQVFVSSTFTDLIEERQAAVEAILSSGNIPAGMELFSAGDESQMTIIKRWIDESDVYMLILGARYGSIEQTSGKSYTHLEYEYAIEQNKPFFAVVLSEKFIDSKVQTNGKGVIELENNKELKTFKELVTSKMVKFCDDKKDIKIAVHETLSQFEYEKKLVGWIRGDNSVNSSLLADEIARLTKENNEFRNSNKYNTALYNGLIFEELYKLIDIECMAFLKSSGNRIATGYSINNKHVNNNYLKKLIIYKIVKLEQKLSNFPDNFFVFTEDGHKFYLRALLNNEED